MPGLFDFSEDFGNKKQANSAGAQPAYIDYSAAYDPNTMSMLKQLEKLWPAYSMGFNQQRDEALQKGPSNWLSMSRMANDAKIADQIEKGRGVVAGNTATAKNALAAGGGLSSGARERAEEQGQKNFMSMTQDNVRQGNLNDLSMNVQDEQNRIGKLQNLTTTEQGRMKDWQQAKQVDDTNLLNENARKNQFNMDKYKAQMEAWAANKQADATSNSSKKS